ncbi:DUF1015 domain-containing protein [Spirochaetota bacterium]
MALIRTFKAIRPKSNLTKEVAELPYDVVTSKEAKSIAQSNEYSFYHVIKPEISLPDDVNIYDRSVYELGKSNLKSFIDSGILIEDEKPRFYLYTLVRNNRSQTGIVASVSVDDYEKGIIKKHEKTREDKERDRTEHLNTVNANTGPVFMTFNHDGSKSDLFKKAMDVAPRCDFTDDNGIRHIVRVIDDGSLIESFIEYFSNDNLYIADGHHRAASAYNVALARKKENPGHTGNEEYNWFLGVIFPHDELEILPYNRVVKDLNGMTDADYLAKLNDNFIVTETAEKVPTAKKCFSMYLNGKWYSLKYKKEVDDNPVNSLDVKILEDRVLCPLLGIDDPRTDKRIDFVGGIKGTDELERLVDSGEYGVAFSLYATSIEELIEISDCDLLMPPKSTWFEPKLMSGLFVHMLD